jgi:hypothetical protein
VERRQREYGIEEANAYSERLDTDIRKSILKKRKTREQEIRDGNSGHSFTF